MPSIDVPSVSAALTANGTADGYATVASNAAFYPGCEAWIMDDNSGSQRCIITDLSGTTLVGLRFIAEDNQGRVLPQPQYGRSNLSAFTTAQNAKLYMPAQLAPVDPAFSKKLSFIGE